MGWEGIMNAYSLWHPWPVPELELGMHRVHFWSKLNTLCFDNGKQPNMEYTSFYPRTAHHQFDDSHMYIWQGSSQAPVLTMGEWKLELAAGLHLWTSLVAYWRPCLQSYPDQTFCWHNLLTTSSTVSTSKLIIIWEEYSSKSASVKIWPGSNSFSLRDSICDLYQ